MWKILFCIGLIIMMISYALIILARRQEKMQGCACRWCNCKKRSLRDD
jgi:hypothetical protein